MEAQHFAYVEYVALARLMAVREAMALIAMNAARTDVVDAVQFIKDLHAIFSGEAHLLPLSSDLASNERQIQEMLEPIACRTHPLTPSVDEVSHDK